MIAFIDEYRSKFGVEPICDVLCKHGCGIAPNTYWVAKKRPPSARALRDVELVVEVRRVFEEQLESSARCAGCGGATGRSPAVGWCRRATVEILNTGGATTWAWY